METMDRFFEVLQSTLDYKYALNQVYNCLWRAVSNQAVEEADQVDGPRGVARFSTTWVFNMVFLGNPGPFNCHYLYLCVPDTYIS